VQLEPTFVAVDKYGRLRLPTGFSETQSWLAGAGQVDAWLYVIEPGRYRLLSEADVDHSNALKRAIQRITTPQRPDPNADPFEAESSELASVGALAIRVKISYADRVGWRVNIPTHSYAIASLAGERGFFLLLSEGYIEFWTTEVLTKALPKAADEVIA
jgi:hypothetical protein